MLGWRPSIVQVAAHDLGTHLRCYGVATVRSPYLDALARGGVRVSDAFAVTSECAPSWAALPTGRYPHCTGVMGRSGPHFAWQLGAGERHLAELLRSAGCATALAGANDVGAAPVARTGCFVAPSAEAADDPAGARRYGFEEAMPATLGQAVAEHAVGCLERGACSGRPFYLQVGFLEARRQASASAGSGGVDPDRMGFLGDDLTADDSLDVTVPPYVRDTPAARGELAELQGAIRYLAEQVGTVLDALRLLDLEQDTLVVFTTDHGIAMTRAKSTLYDAGIGIALIVRIPARGWVGGRVQRELASNVDIVPTLLDGAGVPRRPAGSQPRRHARRHARTRSRQRLRRYELPELLRPAALHPHRPPRADRLLHRSGDPHTADRSGDPAHDPGEAQADLQRVPSMAEMFDLHEEPEELDNVIDRPAYRQASDELVGCLYRWMRDTGDPLLDGAIAAPMQGWARRVLEEASTGRRTQPTQ